MAVHYSENLCTHVCGLQVAVAVGLKVVPLGGKGLESPALALVVVVPKVVEVVMPPGVVVVAWVSIVVPTVLVGAPLLDLIYTACSCQLPLAPL